MPPKKIISDHVPPIVEEVTTDMSDMENIPLSLGDISIPNNLDDIHTLDFSMDFEGNTPIQEHESSFHQRDDHGITRSLGLNHAHNT